MEIKEANKWLKHGDRVRIAEKLGIERFLVQDVLAGKSDNELVKLTIIKLAIMRKDQAERAATEILDEN